MLISIAYVISDACNVMSVSSEFLSASMCVLLVLKQATSCVYTIVKIAKAEPALHFLLCKIIQGEEKEHE